MGILFGWFLGWTLISLKEFFHSLRSPQELPEPGNGHYEMDAGAPIARGEEENGAVGAEGILDDASRRHSEHYIPEPARRHENEGGNHEEREPSLILEARERRQALMEEQEREKPMDSQERERLAVEEAKRQSHEEHMRYQLTHYKLGDKIHLASFRALQPHTLDDVTNVRLAMFGPAGSGKSCFINTCERAVLQRARGSAVLSSSSMEGTTILDEFFHELPLIRLVDTRGHNNFDEFEINEVKRILSGGIKPGDFIDRDPSHPQLEVGEDIPFGSLVHGVIFVVKANDVRLKNKALERKLERLRKEGLHRQGLRIEPVTVVTHQDRLGEDQYEYVKKLASAATGSSPHHTFLLTNYCKENPNGNSETVSTTLTVLQKALTVAERFIRNAKLRMKTAQIDAVRGALDGYNEQGGLPETVRNAPLPILFRDVLQQRHEWSTGQVDQVLEVFNIRDVFTILALVICWDDVKPILVEQCGHHMVKTIERDLDRLNIEH